MPRWFSLAALLLLTLLSAEVQLFGVSSQAGLLVLATSRELRQKSLSRVTRSVKTCEELQDALKDLNVLRIFVDGEIVCTRSNWPQPITIRRNVVVSGDISKLGDGRPSNSTDVLQHSVDWTSLRKVLVVERGATLSFYDMLMRQAEMGLAGFNIAFLHTSQSATAVFAGIVMIVDTCPEPVGFFQVAFAGLQRPQFVTGEQRTRPLGRSSFLIEDVSIEWPRISSLWQICNMVFECGVTDPRDPRILEHFRQPYVLPLCTTSDGEGPLSEAGLGSEDAVSITAVPDSHRNRQTSIVGTVVVVVAVTAIVVAMTAGFTYYLIFRGRKQAPRPSPVGKTNRKDEPSTSKGKDRKNDPRLQKNSFAYEMFEKSINVPLQDVEVGALLGRGGFGKVYKGTWKGTTVAVKVIEHGQRLMENELKLPFEAYLSKQISHPNVVQTFLIHTRQQDSPHGVTVDTMDLNESSTQPIADKNSLMSSHDIFSNMAKGSIGNEGGELFETWLVLEYCDRGSLAKAVKKGLLSNRKTAKPIMDHVLLSALDVANAMNYLHSLGITHGDLKADNVLLKSASTDRRGFFCKVSDFGLSRFMDKSEYIQTFTYGTITHMPPELLKDGILTPSVDIYSFGMLLWELLGSKQPYSEKNHGEIILAVVNEGRRPHIGPGFPDCYADLIRDCWKQNRHDRPSFEDIVKRLKQMLVNLDAYGSCAAAAMTDSAGSLSRIRGRMLLDTPQKMDGEFTLTMSPVQCGIGSSQQEITPLPEVNRLELYYAHNSTVEGKDSEDAAEVMLLPRPSSSCKGDDDIDTESDNSYSFLSDGFRSAASHVTHSSDSTFVSQHFPGI